MSNVPVALQLYTVRDVTATDFPGTVRQVAQMGYAGVEFAGTGGLGAQAMADLLAETGLRAAGSHVGLPEMEANLDGVIEYHKAIGCAYVGVPFLAREMQNPAGFRRLAEALNRIGAQLKVEGMTLYYHNHAFEFDRTDGERGWDILLGETDPSVVAMEIDVYWAHYAGENAAGLIRASAGRFPLVHLKDMTGQGEARTFAEVGEGQIDFVPIFEASEAQGVAWYIVEQDRCARPSRESARLSLENLRRWGKA